MLAGLYQAHQSNYRCRPTLSAAYRESIGWPGYHSRQVSAAFIAQQATMPNSKSPHLSIAHTDAHKPARHARPRLSSQASAATYLSQLACVVLMSPTLRFAVSQAWSDPRDAQPFLEPKTSPPPPSSFPSSQRQLSPLEALCAKAPPLPVEAYETHGLKRRQKDLLAETLRPFPPRYPLLC